MSMKNSSDKIVNRTRDLPACSAVPEPTASPRAPKGYYWLTWTCETEVVAFWCEDLLLPVVKLRDWNSSILIIRYGLRIMSLWGCGERAGRGQQLGFGCRETAKQGIDRTEYCCRNTAALPPPTAPNLLSVRSPCCLRCAVSTVSEPNSDSRVLCPHCLIWTRNGEVMCEYLKFSQRY